MQAKEIIRELPKGLIKWYKFEQGKHALLVTVDNMYSSELDDIIAEALEDYELIFDKISVMDIMMAAKADKYDYIISVGAVERCNNPGALLCRLRGMLCEDGRLLLGMDNRLGIRYFCGDRDAFTGRNFDSIENYSRVWAADKDIFIGRAYAKAEIAEMLEKAGFDKYRFYSVMPEIARPQALYAEDYVPNEAIDVRVAPQYNSPDTVFLEEERMYKALLDNGMFHSMANGYFVECPLNGDFANVLQVTISMDRGPENALLTIIRRDEKVEKRAVYDEGVGKLQLLVENGLDLERRGIPVVKARLEGSSCIMPYVHGKIATEYFRELILKDKELFLQKLDIFWELILASSDSVPYDEVDWEHFDPDWMRQKKDAPDKDKWKRIALEGTEEERENLGVILKRGYIDLVCLNCFYADDEFVFYDQEFFMENLPAKVILWRTIVLIYGGGLRLEEIIPINKLFERYRLTEYLELWQRFAGFFTWKLRKEEELFEYHKLCRRDFGVINSNRQRMNYSQNEYERLFRDIFRELEGRKLFLFGSGKFAGQFLSQFGNDYEIAGILDNNSAKWGTKMSGIEISPPSILENLPEGTYKVIICIKNYVQVMRQLDEMRVHNYSVYDSNLTYPRKSRPVAGKACELKKVPKKYHTGYIAGVFDLFHVGHLNLFKRAKEQCDYLIVGVVSDEAVIKNKKTTPYIPFEERIEIVRSCRYVDEAVAIPADNGDTDEAYRRYQFDVQFSGSDYENDPVWLAKKAFLQKHGSDLIFFPYTQSTSSTKIKGKLKEE